MTPSDVEPKNSLDLSDVLTVSQAPPADAGVQICYRVLFGDEESQQRPDGLIPFGRGLAPPCRERM